VTATDPAPPAFRDRPRQDAALGAAMIGLSMVLFGLVPFFARHLTEAGLAPPALSMYRFMLPAIVFLPFLRPWGERGRASLWAFGSGVMVAAGWMGYYSALSRMPVPLLGVLYMTYPLFVLVIGWAFFRDRPHPRAWAGGGLILLAAVLAAGLSGGQPVGAAGLALALTAPLAFGFGVNVLTHRLAALHPLSRIAAFSAGSTLGLAPVIAGLPRAAVIPDRAEVWLLVLGLTLVTALVPQIIYNIWVPRIGAAKAAVLGALELPAIFAVGWFALGDPVGPREIAAGLLILVAILLTPSKPPVPAAAGPAPDSPRESESKP